MTTHDHEIDEELQSQGPPPEEVEPLKITLQTAAQFLSQAQEPELAAKIDAMIETIQTTTGATDRKMLRAYALTLRSIGTSMPWDEDEGLDARRFHMPSKTALPSWRAVIGACLQLEFDKPDAADEVTTEKVDDVGVMEEAIRKPAELAVPADLEETQDDEVSEE